MTVAVDAKTCCQEPDTDNHRTLSESRYFLTILDPDTVTADELLAPVRNHWQIENSVFFLKDRWWVDDLHWTRRPGLSEWLAQLSAAATVVLRRFNTTGEPLRAKAYYIQWNPCLGSLTLEMPDFAILLGSRWLALTKPLHSIRMILLLEF